MWNNILQYEIMQSFTVSNKKGVPFENLLKYCHLKYNSYFQGTTCLIAVYYKQAIHCNDVAIMMKLVTF